MKEKTKIHKMKNDKNRKIQEYKESKIESTEKI
jgi:hypothetical protein